MKAITYKIEKVMRTIVVSLIIVLALSGITKAGNFSSQAINENELANQVKSWMGNSAYWIESDNQPSKELTADSVENVLNNETEVAGQELAQQMESWMNNSTYWVNNTENEDQELTIQMKSWINNTTLWSDDAENNDQELALQMKSWINSKSFWRNNHRAQDHHLTGEIKTWMSTSAFWTGTEEPIYNNNELASN